MALGWSTNTTLRTPSCTAISDTHPNDEAHLKPSANWGKHRSRRDSLRAGHNYYYLGHQGQTRTRSRMAGGRHGVRSFHLTCFVLSSFACVRPQCVHKNVWERRNPSCMGAFRWPETRLRAKQGKVNRNRRCMYRQEGDSAKL